VYGDTLPRTAVAYLKRALDKAKRGPDSSRADLSRARRAQAAGRSDRGHLAAVGGGWALKRALRRRRSSKRSRQAAARSNAPITQISRASPPAMGRSAGSGRARMAAKAVPHPIRRRSQVHRPAASRPSIRIRTPRRPPLPITPQTTAQEAATRPRRVLIMEFLSYCRTASKSARMMVRC
jgi:hypothetical protein